MSMIFEVENKAAVSVANFPVIKKSLASLKSYGRHSFASLTKADGSYVQVAGGGMTCILEKHMPSEGIHCRAYLEKPRPPFEGEVTLFYGGGQIKALADEILPIDIVTHVFYSFFTSIPIPENLYWRDISFIFR